MESPPYPGVNRAAAAFWGLIAAPLAGSLLAPLRLNFWQPRRLPPVRLHLPHTGEAISFALDVCYPKFCERTSFLGRQPMSRVPRAKGGKHVLHQSCWIAPDFVVLGPDRIGHTSCGPTSSGYPRGFGYKGQISSGVYERREFRNN